MTHSAKDGGPAFPRAPIGEDCGRPYGEQSGMSLHDWFAGQALSNPAICTGEAPDWQLRKWFGGRGRMTREEIVARQAQSYAAAMIADRTAGEKDHNP